MEKDLEGAFIPPLLLPPWIVEERSDAATSRDPSDVTRPRSAAPRAPLQLHPGPVRLRGLHRRLDEGEALHAVLDGGEMHALWRLRPRARGFDRERDLAVDVGEAFEATLGLQGLR